MAAYREARLQSTSTMEMSPTPNFDQPGGLPLEEEDEQFLRAEIQWKGIAKPMRLRQVTVMCLIFNRMIGTGIFRTPAIVYNYTESVGISMLWWSLGLVVAMCGILVYMELGLTLPLYRFDGKTVSVPRSGGELNYLKYMYQRPLYFAICIFGISFILLGNVATNSMAFGMSVLDAAGKSESDFENYDEVVRGIAIACIAFSCLIHGVWRQGGLYLNNLLAFIKIAILVLIFIIGLLAYGGVFGKVEGALSTKGAFNKDRRAGDAYGYAEAFLSVIYAFSGFNQANYVIGEVDDPRRRYKWPAFSAVAIVSVLYILVNLAYFIVVPTIKFDEALTRNVAHEFFDLTLGSLSSSWAPNAPRLLSAFMAIASLGNILVFTYTAARVKQEIAKEGIIPFRRFFASSIKSARIPIRKLWGSKLETLPEDIPFGALILHFSMSVLLILGTWQLTAFATYSLLVDLYSYTVEATFSTIIGFGLVYQRLFSSRDWNELSRNSGFKVNTFVSCTTGLIFGLANLYPVATKWVPPQLETAQDYPWYTTGVVGWSILAFGAIWWAFFRFVVPHIGHDHKGRYLLVTRKLWFHTENEYKVLEYEDIDFNWVPNDDEEDGLGRGDGHHARVKLRERSVFASGAEVAKRRRDDGIFGE